MENLAVIRRAAAIAIAGLLAGCAVQTPASGPELAFAPTQTIAVLNRVTWGVNDSTVKRAGAAGLGGYLQGQLHPGAERLPAAIEAQLAALTIGQRPLDQLVFELERQRKEADALGDDEAKKGARQAYQQELNRLAREAATRSLLRAVYSPNQLQEQVSWFWMNHFSVHQGKHNLRAMVGDYEEQAIRPHALGKFRDLLAATVHHPAMLRYLDNEQNAAGRINENYARELMELHTLGVDGGYSQRDVQELARVLTGVGVNLGPEAPKVKRELQGDYRRAGLYEFNPNRHDYGAKQLLGQPLRRRGPAEVDEAIARLSAHPATARFVSRKLAQFFVADEAPAALVERMAQTFLRSDGDIAATLQTMLASAEFAASLGHKFKDPQHYAVSALRLAYDDKPILNAGPLLNWLKRMGEPLYGRQTPDGYPLTQAAWASPGQMSTRFEIAKAIGGGSAGLFKADGPQAQEKAAFPQLSNALYFSSLKATLAPATLRALDQAASPQEWNAYLLSAPEMMYR
ncbi:DUF1800 domain-containing protein [Rugamonas sp. DEMB1]|uniref:DUF1800 domain-containing protein n=1 Tax=Rugamonas sp. DEMB1 TaxID=3039386 RepID=UPI00244D0DE8|nr:DUF1800 domain-containing protein [Rugamonas sp. DEMB1]WGG52495.1 DUF1800 domain-containing protein [Rugamonas sp. DEMB1]